MSHSLEAAFTRLISKHFPEDEDQDDWDFEEEFSKSKRKKKKFNKRGLKSIDDYIGGAPKMSFDPTSKMFVPEGERRELPQRPSNLPLPMFNNMAMARMPNGGMFPSQHPNMQFHPSGQPQFGNPAMYPPQLYQNSMPPQFAYGFGNPAQLGQMRQMNPRNMPPNFHSQAMGFPGMTGQQLMGQQQMQGGAQPIGMNQNQIPGQRMPLGVGQNQIPGQPVMPNQNQIPSGQLGIPNQGQPLAGVEQGRSTVPNQGRPPMTSQSQLVLPQTQQDQGSKTNAVQVSSSAIASVLSPSTGNMSSPSVGAANSPATQKDDDDKGKEVTSPSSATSPIATSGEATPPSWTTEPSRESAAVSVAQQYPGQKPQNYMQHPAYAQMQQNPYYPPKNPAYRHPMAAYGGPHAGTRPMWDPSMGQFPRQFQHMRPQDPSMMQKNPMKRDSGRSIDLTQGRFNPGTMPQMSSPSQIQNPLSAQSSTPTRSEDSPARKSDNESQDSQADKIDAPGVQTSAQLHNKGISQEKQQQQPDHRQYPAVVPERELASMRQGMIPSPQQSSQFMEQQRAKMQQSSFMHSNPLFDPGDQPLRKLEEMAFSKEGGSTRPHILSPEHQQDDQSRQQNQSAANIQGSPASNSTPTDPEIPFPFMMGRNGQHQRSKDNQEDSDSLPERPNSSPNERNIGQRKSILPLSVSPEHVSSTKQNLSSESRSGNSNINGASSLVRTNGSSQSVDETIGKQKNENTGRPDLMQSQNYMMGNLSSYTSHSIASHLNVHKERTLQETSDKREETPSTRNSMISYLKELSSRNPVDPLIMHAEKSLSEQSHLNTNMGANDPSKSRDMSRLRPPPPLQMHSGDPLHLGLSYQSTVAGGQAELHNRHRQISAPLPAQRAKPQEEDHARAIGSMYIDLDQRQPNQSIMNLDKSVQYHHPQSLYSPQQHEALRRQQMFMLQRQMQAQEMGPYMSSQMSAAQSGRTAMDFSMLQQQQYLNAYGRHLGRNGEFPGGFPTHDMSTKPRFS